MTDAPPHTQSGRASLVTPTFALLVLSALGYFTAMGMLLPVLPRYVEDQLDGNGLQVGVAVGAFAVSAALARPFAGRLGDRLGRRPLAVGGAAIAAGSVLFYGVVPTLVALVLFRLVTGIGEAGFFVGAATAAQDLSPDDRRGEAASFFSTAIYGGLAVGPFLGEWLYHDFGAGRVWLVAAGLAGFGSLVALLIPGSLGKLPEGSDPAPGGRLLHPAALMPGSILLLGLFGFAAFSAFLPLYVDQVGTDDAGPFFLVYGISVLVVRIFGARIPDRLGAVRTTTLSLIAIATGVTVIAAFASVPAVYAGTVVFSAGMALLFPALFGLTINRAPAAERGHAVGTFSLGFDLSQGLGAPFLGLLVTITGAETAAFYGAAVVALIGLVLVRARLAGAG